MLLSDEEKLMTKSANVLSSDAPVLQSSAHPWLITLGVVGTLAIGFALRYALMLQDAVINEDGIYYVERAKKLMSGDVWNGISAYWSPLYSLLTGLAGGVVRDFELGGRVV